MSEKEKIKYYKRLTKQMVKESLNDVIDRKLDKVFKVGVININDFELDYLLPKIIASALLKEAAFQSRPLGSEYKDLVEQLYNKM
jgi:hypothetical protein